LIVGHFCVLVRQGNMYTHAPAAVIHSYVHLRDVWILLLQTSRFQTQLNEWPFRHSLCYCTFLIMNPRFWHIFYL